LLSIKKTTMDRKKRSSRDEETAELLKHDPRGNIQLEVFEFERLPKDVQKYIAYMTPGILMLLAQSKPSITTEKGKKIPSIFVLASRDDEVWKRFFQRDFLKDWEFCRGKLPFYVLDTTHPLYSKNQISPQDASPWKRFYLHTARLYRLAVKMFVKYYQQSLVDADVPILAYDDATAQEIYGWFDKWIAKAHRPSWDNRATLVSAFIIHLMSIVRPLHVGPLAALPEFVQITNNDTDKWLWLYLQHMHPAFYEFNSVVKNSYYLASAKDIHEQIEDGQTKQDWNRYNTTYLNWRQDRQTFLFSLDDRTNLENFLEQHNVEQDKKDLCLTYWDLLTDCYTLPCISSVAINFFEYKNQNIASSIPPGDWNYAYKDYLIYHTDPSFFYMRRESEILRQYVQKWKVIHNRPGDVNISFKQPTWNNSIFLVRGTQSAFNQKALIRVGKWGEWAAYQNERRMFVAYLSAPREAKKGGNRILLVDEPVCIACGVQTMQLFKCGGKCNDPRVIYCGKQCQLADWLAGHKNGCNNTM